MYDDDDFFLEASEFNARIEEFKASLMTAVKDEFKSEMDRLKTENEALQKVKRDFDAIQREYREKHRQLEYERANMERTVRRERLASLMKDFEVVMWRADGKREYGPKCNKCDEQRRVKYVTPLGRTSEETCDCNVSWIDYHPVEHRASEFKIGRDDNQLSVWYKLVQEKDYDYAIPDSVFASAIYRDGMQYEGLPARETFFKTEADCQAYCDWLNARKADDK
jgi:hypothetical protein